MVQRDHGVCSLSVRQLFSTITTKSDVVKTVDNIDGLRSRKRTMATLDWSRRGDKFVAFNELRTGNRSCHRRGIQD